MRTPEYLSKCRTLYGDVFVVPGLLGRPNWIMVLNPEDFLTVIRCEGKWPYRRRLDTMTYYRTVYRRESYKDGLGLFSSNGEDWGRARSTVNPVLMKPQNVNLYLNSLLQVSDEFLERIRMIRDPETLEVPDYFEDEINRLSFESTALIALNRRLNLIHKNRNENDEIEVFFESLRQFFDLALKLDLGLPTWKFFKTKQFYDQMRNYDVMREFSSKYVMEELRRIESSQSLRSEDFSILEKILKVDRSSAHILACDLIIAGVDTVSSSLTAILLCLAKNPEKQEIVRQEVRKILPNKDSLLTIENMKNLPYLRASIKEAMRVYPIGVAIARTNGEDIILSGYRIPKGQEILLHQTFLLTMDEYCPKAKEFIPERWLRGVENDCAPMYPFMHTPFSHGPRNCVGKRIAELELEISVAKFVRNFHIEFNYSTENAFKNRFINVPAIPLKFKFAEVEE